MSLGERRMVSCTSTAPILEYLADQRQLGVRWETLAWKGLVSGQDGDRECHRARKRREGTMKESRHS